MILNCEKYDLIRIGDFSHGDENIFEYRLKLLKYFIKNTNKNITIFNEDTEKNCKNIMNINKKLSYYKSYGIINNYGYGKLDKYCYRVYDSKIYLEIIKYIRKNIGRITIIGVDGDNISRDKQMANNILKKINKNNINLFFGHNNHIGTGKITELYETKWSKEKYRTGYFLKKILKNKYYIILSQGYKGKIRYNGWCNDKYCTIRTAYKIPKILPLEIKEYKNIKSGLYDKFNNKLYSTTACIFKDKNIFEYKSKYNKILFFKNIKPLKLL